LTIGALPGTNTLGKATNAAPGIPNGLLCELSAISLPITCCVQAMLIQNGLRCCAQQGSFWAKTDRLAFIRCLNYRPKFRPGSQRIGSSVETEVTATSAAEYRTERCGSVLASASRWPATGLRVREASHPDVGIMHRDDKYGRFTFACRNGRAEPSCNRPPAHPCALPDHVFRPNELLMVTPMGNCPASSARKKGDWTTPRRN
jgi:hypothetical protein